MTRNLNFIENGNAPSVLFLLNYGLNSLNRNVLVNKMVDNDTGLIADTVNHIAHEKPFTEKCNTNSMDNEES